MKVAHGLVGIAVVACVGALGLLAYVANGTPPGDGVAAGVLTATSTPARLSAQTPVPSEAPAAPAAQTFMVGPWEVAILSTDRDAADTIGQGNHPDDFPAVLTTVQITNTAGYAQDATLLDFEFGSMYGTQNGYSPWDDWCAPTDDNIYGGRTLYLPGETRTVSVCVPVDPRDAADLAAWISYYDGNESEGEVELLLPPDGANWSPQPEEPVAVVQARALALASRTADGWGYRVTVSNVTIGDEVDGQRVVSVSLDASPTDPSFPPAGYVLSSAIAASGAIYGTTVCHSGEYRKKFDGSAWNQDLCVTVDAADAESLLLVFDTMYINEPGLLLDARPS